VEDKGSPNWLDLMAMGLASAIMIGAGLGLGVWIDSELGSSPIASFIGLAFGIFCAVGSTVRQVRKFL
jgi:F0F1-type ATP synthase assembly protein I